MKTQEQSKNEIKNELQNLNKTIEDLTKRREALYVERDWLVSNLEAQTRDIGAALLDGLDSSQASESLSRDKTRLEGLREAINQADERLSDLKRQQTDKNKALVMFDYNARTDEAYILFLECVDRLDEANSALNLLDAKFIEINQVGQPIGMNSDHDDHLRLLNQMRGYLKGEGNPANGILYKIEYIKTNFKTIFEIARQKKGK